MPRTRRNRARRAASKRASALASVHYAKIYRKKKRNYKGLPASFANNMRKYNTINCEKKIMTFNNYLNGPGSQGYLQDIPAASLNNAGLTNDALTCVVLQTGRQLTQLNASLNSNTGQTMCYAMDGYSVLQGDTQNRLVGSYGKITSSYLNLNITMDPTSAATADDVLDASLPHQFRLIQVKARREKMVSPGAQVASYGVPSIAKNLFRDESGGARGINAECATQDVFTWFVNKQFWTVLKDERFTLSTPVISNVASEGLVRAYQPTVKDHKSARFKKYWLPKPKTKVRFEANTVDSLIKQEVVDFNYVVHTIILCKNTSSGERPSNHWNVQANGATQFIDE